MKSVNPMMVVAVLLWVVCGAAWAGGSIEFSGGGGGFSGGTVSNAVVLTGDNASGTGTLRIRPSDEDTQLVLCEASNNASPEVCSNWQHYNQSANAAGSFFATNLYLDSASTLACANGAIGSGYFQTYASNTQGQAVIGMRHPGGACSSANIVLSCITTGATTATCTWGGGHTTTTDFRGPILNGGSATCSGSNAGAVCLTDSLAIASNTASILLNMTTNTTGYASMQFQDNSATTVGNYAYYGSTFADADYADKVALVGVSKQLMVARTDDVGATSALMTWTDNGSGTGVTLRGIYGDGAQYAEDVTPTALSGAVNDYAGCTLSRCRISGGVADRNITGIASGADGKEFRICNIGTTNNLVLTDEDAASAAANRFALDAAVTILPERCKLITYDGTSSRWRADQ